MRAEAFGMRARAGLGAIIAAFVSSALLAGCRTTSHGAGADDFDRRPLSERVSDPALAKRIEDAALTRLPADVWPGLRTLALRVSIEGNAGSESVDVVLRRRPGVLALDEVLADGKPGFRFLLSDADGAAGTPDALEVAMPEGRSLAISPEAFVADVQHAFYPWLLGVPDCHGCERSGWRGTLAVWERLGDRQLEERRFAISGATEQGSIRIRYALSPEAASVPPRVELVNGWLGHRIVFERLDTVPALDALPPAATTWPPLPSSEAEPATDAEPAPAPAPTAPSDAAAATAPATPTDPATTTPPDAAPATPAEAPPAPPEQPESEWHSAP